LNFEKSSVSYVTDPASERKAAARSPQSDCLDPVIYKGKGPFSNAVSRSFPEHSVMPTITIQVPRFKISETHSGHKYASFLVIVAVHGVSFGVWRRHSDFSTLAAKLKAINDASPNNCPYNNTMLSWQCLLHRKHWLRCLDKDYLALKCFLLERFVHDVLFECESPETISDFLELDIF